VKQLECASLLDRAVEGTTARAFFGVAPHFLADLGKKKEPVSACELVCLSASLSLPPKNNASFLIFLVLLDLFVEVLALERLEAQALEAAQEHLDVVVRQQDSRAGLADLLQNHGDGLEIADVEDGQLKVDVAKVARAGLALGMARLARRPVIVDTLWRGGGGGGGE
jgi:hypothetical protein